MSEDTIINLLAGGTLLFAVVLSILIKNTKAHKVLTFIFYPLIKLKEWLDPDYWANRIGEKSGAYDKARAYGKKEKPWYIKGALIVVIIALFFFMAELQAGDNHIHVDQVGNGGDDITLTIDQIGHNNEVDFSFAHSDNTIILKQYGAGNKVSWVPYWGSGKSWGGDIDGTGNNLNIEQHDGATYGGHVWGNDNDVDIYQNVTHTHYLDIHTDDVDHDIRQEDGGSSYSHVWYYGSQDGSVVNIQQKGGGSHNATIQLQGSKPTTLNLIQDSASNKSYSLTQNCVTNGGCSVTVTQD